MENKNKTSGLVAVIQTALFFGIILGVFGMAFYFLTDGGNAVKPKTEGYKSLEISALADFDYYSPRPGQPPEPELLAKNQIPEKIKQLDGQRVSITGFMMPVRVDNQGFVEEFALNGNYDMCFYGAPSRLNQWIHVRMQPGTKAKFSHNPTTVAGTLQVGELVEDGEVISLYRLEGDKATSVSRRGFF